MASSSQRNNMKSEEEFKGTCWMRMREGHVIVALPLAKAVAEKLVDKDYGRIERHTRQEHS